jgi:dihydroorotase
MHDLILRGGRVIDPATHTDHVVDIAISDGIITAIEPNITGDALSTKNCAGLIVTPGLIDLHTHVYWGGTSIGIDPDEYALRAACTTLVDAGTAGPGNFAGFRKHIIEPATVRVLPFLNASFAGIFAFSKTVMVGECVDIRLVNARDALDIALEHADIIPGIKVRVGLVASGISGIEPMNIALDVCEEANLPLMCHLDFPPPSRAAVVSRLRPGDILTHCFKPFPNAPVRIRDGKIYEEIIAAKERGVIFDIGHGKGSFAFQTTRAMLDAGFMPDVISSDVHSVSIEGPAFDQLVTMSKFLALDMPLMDVIACSTVNAAKALRRSDLGRLTVGGIADVSILDLISGDFTFEDVVGEQVKAQTCLRPRGMVMAGSWSATTDAETCN